MQEKNKRLIDNILSMGALQLVMYIFPLITAPYITRVIGVENYGLVAFANSLIQYFVLFVDYGFELSATKKISQNTHNQNNLSKIFSSVMFAKFILFFISFIIMLLLIIFVPKFHEIWLLIVFSFLTVVGNIFYPVWFFLGVERMRYVTYLNILSRSIFVILLFVFIKKADDYLWLPVLTSIGSLIAGFLSLRLAVKEFGIKLYFPKLKSMLDELKYSTQFFFTRLASYGKANTNTFVLGLLTSNLLVGYYAAAYNIFWAINCFTATVEVSLFPYMNKNKDLKLFKKVFFLCLLGFGLMSIFIYIFAKPIISIYYGAAMTEAYKILRIFCITLFVQRMAGIIGYPLLGAFGHTKECNNATIYSVIIHVICLGLIVVFNKLSVYSIAYLVVFSALINILIKICYIIKYKLLTNKAV